MEADDHRLIAGDYPKVDRNTFSKEVSSSKVKFSLQQGKDVESGFPQQLKIGMLISYSSCPNPLGILLPQVGSRDCKGRGIAAFGIHCQHWDCAQMKLLAILAIRNYIQDWMLEVEGGMFRDCKGRGIAAFGIHCQQWDCAQMELLAILAIRNYIQDWMLEVEGHLVSYVMQKKYNLVHPDQEYEEPLYYNDGSFRAIFKEESGKAHVISDTEKEHEGAPAPANEPNYQNLVQRFDQLETHFDHRLDQIETHL
ncbi:hypothetical protein MA16_Dca005728 [Dendrobium catenatum]|uniref:RNase H type-1 domain-containing protein n=1 Tax=Dendrobium catenatum TaxID=906689 RepID=A0A2I0WX24_9ASPA|nr:hypothetical protein MA16_Dca005728 [Dendrobium catenatum]